MSRAIPLLPLWVFGACYMVTFTFYFPFLEGEEERLKVQGKLKMGSEVKVLGEMCVLSLIY
jgi:hypothetical protein